MKLFQLIVKVLLWLAAGFLIIWAVQAIIAALKGLKIPSVSDVVSNVAGQAGNAAGSGAASAVTGAFNGAGTVFGTAAAKVYGDLFPSEQVVFDPTGQINGAWASPEATAEAQIANASLYASLIGADVNGAF